MVREAAQEQVALEREAQVRLERPLEAQQVPVTALQADRVAAVAAGITHSERGGQGAASPRGMRNERTPR